MKEQEEQQLNCLVEAILYLGYIAKAGCIYIFEFIVFLINNSTGCVVDIYRQCYSKKLVIIFSVAIVIGAIPLIYVMQSDNFYYGQ